MKKLMVMVIVAVCVAGSASAAGLKQEAEGRRCSNSTLKGSYGFIFEGTAPWGTFRAVGVTTFDGNGELLTFETITVNGISAPGTFSGTYSVNANCTGVAVSIHEGMPPSELAMSIVRGGEQVYALITDPGVTITGTFTKQ